MKRNRIGIISLVFLFSLTNSLPAQNFKPFSRLFCIQTEHFEIIYPEGSRESAYKLADRADDIYDYVSGLLGIELEGRVAVTITPATDEHNGYMNPVPYPHILLFDTLSDLEWSSFTNTLENLFLHEMTHSVSGSTRGPVMRGLNKVFGGWVYPAGLTAPWFMIEGISVSFESLDGSGRSNDPLIKEYLRQDIIENKFKTPFQAEGVYDLPPNSHIYYYYGGLFSTYLQETYGMEKYAELWKQMGRQFHISLIFYNFGFYDIFKKVYDKPILDAWNDFKKSLELQDVKENKNGLIYGGKALIKDVASGGGKIYFLDSVAQKIIEYDPVSKKTRNAVSLDSIAYALDVSEDGKNILVSTYLRLGANTGQLSRAVVVEYSTQNGFLTGRRWNGLYNARYFRNGVIALNTIGHKSNIVYRNGDDKKGDSQEVLLKGTDELSFSNPSPINGNLIAFTSAKRGVRELSFFNYETKQIYALKSDDEPELFKYMRGLRFQKDSLVLSNNDDDRLYKLVQIPIDSTAAIETGVTLSANSSVSDFSGGIFNPVRVEGDVYYRASFSIWDAVMRYPAADGGDQTRTIDLKPVPWEDKWTSIALELEKENKPLVIDTREKNYFPLKYFNPLKLWIPYPVVNPMVNAIFMDGEAALSAEGNFKKLHFDGAGIFTFLADPADDNLLFLGAAYDAHHKMAPISLTWYNFSLGLPIITEFHDSVMENDFETSPGLRIIDFSVSATKRIPLWNGRTNISIRAAMNCSWFFYEYFLYGDKEESAYNMPYQSKSLWPNVSVSLTNFTRMPWEIFGSGISNSLTVYGLIAEKSYPRFDLVSTVSWEAISFFKNIPVLSNFAFRNSIYAGFDENGMNAVGTSINFSSSSFSSYTTTEYAMNKFYYPFKWILGGEAELKPFSIEIQKNFSHIYFNRFYMTMGYRWTCFGEQNSNYISTETLGKSDPWIHSLLLRAGLVLSVVPVTVLPVKITIGLTGALKLSALDNNNTKDDFYFGWAIGAQY